jgi:hypothetical protein
MKKAILIFLLFSSFYSNSQTWQSSIHIAAPNQNGAGIECIDGLGNYYITGIYYGNYCKINQDSLNATFVGANTFVAKINPAGATIWKHNLGSNFSNNCYTNIKMIFDSISNSILFIGIYCGPMVFSDTTLISGGTTTKGIFGKMDLDGNLIWSKSISGLGKVELNTLGFDYFDNFYVVGTNTNPIYINNDTLPLGTFIIKYTNTGSYIWSKNISGKGKYPSSIGFDRLNMQIRGDHIFIAGQGSDTLKIDTVKFVQPNKAMKVISEFDLNGDFKWAKLVGYFLYGTIATPIALDNQSNIYSLYTIGDSATFGNSIYFKTGFGDIVLVKQDSIGNIIWVKLADFSSLAYGGNYIASDKQGDIYITGSFGGTFNLDTYTLTSSSTYDMFIAKYDANGNCKGANNFGQAEGLSIAINANNEPIISGLFYNNVLIGSSSYTSLGAADGFIAKHDVITNVQLSSKPQNNKLLIHANPNTGKCYINLPLDMIHEKNMLLSIYSSQGKLIQQIPVNTSEEKIKINLEAEASGIYNAVLSNGSKSYSGKIVFE